jgi:hypothetical protein
MKKISVKTAARIRRFFESPFNYANVMWYIGLACLAVLLALLIPSNRPGAAYIRDGHVQFSEAESYLLNRISQKGADRVRDEVEIVGNTLSPAESHVLAHVFGGALYRTKGLDGYASCSTSFLYGCIHQFVGMAISEFGSAVAIPLYAACTKKWGEDSLVCHHAMGHGFVGYYGYTFENLSASMRACDLVEPEERPYFYRCLNGAFMEYNFREIEPTEDVLSRPREFSADAPYAPCDQLSGRYQSACFRQLPLWWYHLSDSAGPSERSFAAAGAYCAGARTYGEEQSQSCFRGLGFVAARAAELDASKARHLCAIGAALEEDRVLCFSDAIYQMRIEGVTNYSQLCEDFGLKRDELDYCHRRASYPI